MQFGSTVVVAYYFVIVSYGQCAVYFSIEALIVNENVVI